VPLQRRLRRSHGANRGFLGCCVATTRATWRSPVFQRYGSGVVTCWLATSFLRFGDIHSRALQGFPPEAVLTHHPHSPLPGCSARWSPSTLQAACKETVHSTRTKSTHLRGGKCPHREDFGSPLAAQVGGYSDEEVPWYAHPRVSTPGRRNNDSEASHGFCGSLQRHQERSPVRTCCQERARGFASPTTFPSQRFSRSQGFAPPSPSTCRFNQVATHGISFTGLKILPNRSSANRKFDVRCPWITKPKRCEGTRRQRSHVCSLPTSQVSRNPTDKPSNHSSR
jgi:hypothetical protein